MFRPDAPVGGAASISTKDGTMSLDSSLKTGGNLVAKRSVLKRHERLVLLKKNKGYDEKTKPVIGLPKTDARVG